MNTVRSLIDNNAERHGDKTFLIAPETGAVMTYLDLQQHCLEVASMLDSFGLENDDKVAMLMPNGYWTAAVFLAVMYSGRAIVPLNAVSGESALDYVIEHSDAKLLLIDKTYRPKYATTLEHLPAGVKQVDVDIDDGLEWVNESNHKPSFTSLGAEQTAYPHVAQHYCQSDFVLYSSRSPCYAISFESEIPYFFQ